MQHLAPIALFVFNRPEHTRRTLKFLSQNLLADESRLFIFSDGPRSDKDKKDVEEVRELVKTIEGFRSVEVIERKENLGLANSIISGVSKLVDEYGKVIVFEDDLISSPYTLQYFNLGLDKFKSVEKVMHIGAYMFPLKLREWPQTFFHRTASSWGWATWKRAWDKFEPDIDVLISQFDKQKIRDFSINGAMNYWKQVGEFRAGKNNSWAIRWYASMFLAGGLALYPSRSLVNNIGHDGTGVHSGKNNIYHVEISPFPVTEFPAAAEETKAINDAIQNFLKNRRGSLLRRGIRFVRNLISTAS